MAKKLGLIAFMVIAMVALVLTFSTPSPDEPATLGYNADGERVIPESQIKDVDPRSGGVEVRLDDAPPPLTRDELAALPGCKEALDALKVGPPLGDQTRCRTVNGSATLLTVALEDSPDWEFVGPGEKMRRKTM